jgi:hypothetical protein
MSGLSLLVLWALAIYRRARGPSRSSRTVSAGRQSLAPFGVTTKGRLIRIGCATVASALLVGCATPYQAGGLRGGYTQTRLEDNVFQVSFQGNAYVSAERVADYTLLRSAEVTLEQGFSHFAIVNSAGFETGGVLVTQNATYQPLITSYSKPSSRNTIVCFKEKPAGFSYDAQQVVGSLREKFGLD